MPQANDALLLGFANDLSAHTLAITFTCRIEGIGVDPTNPPLVWEAWDGVEGRWCRYVWNGTPPGASTGTASSSSTAVRRRLP